MTINDHIHALRQDIEKSSKNSTLNGRSVNILAASKTQPPEMIEQAIEAGITIFGENRVQEAADKWPALKEAHPHVKLHLIGPLQTNKVKQALELFDVIQTLDRPKLADATAKHHRNHPSLATHHYFIQVNIGSEQQKSGILPEDADDFIAYCKHELKLPIAGLMCIPPAEEPATPHFTALRNMTKKHELSQLSMGMSGDYKEAVEAGSTLIRIGTGIFGKRL